MSKVRTYARNLLANWVGYGANLAVMFFVSPFIVHSLGDTAYGVWSLLVSLSGYLGLVELGTRAALGRHITFYLGRKDIPKVNGFINTAMTFFLLAGLGLLAAAAVLGVFFDSLFTKVPTELVGSARLVILLVAGQLWLLLLMAAFAQVLIAFERFDLINVLGLSLLAVRTAGIVGVLRVGGGIVELAVAQFSCSAIEALITGLLARRVFPEMRLRLRLATKALFWELFGYGFWAFLGGIAMNLIWWTQTVVITVLLGPAMVTFYAIPLMLINHGRGIIGEISNILGPQTIKASGAGDFAELRWIWSWGSKIAMFVGIPLLTGLIVFGTEFIALWMGPAYRPCGLILILLTIPQFFVQAIRPGGNIIAGLGYVRFAAVVTLLQGVANLALTLTFVMVWGLGLPGVALGTFVPMVLFNVWMVHVILGWIRFPAVDFLRNYVLRWCLCTAMFAAACYAINLVPCEPRWWSFFLKVIVAAMVFVPLGWYVIFNREEQLMLFERVAALFSRGRPANPLESGRGVPKDGVSRRPCRARV